MPGHAAIDALDTTALFVTPEHIAFRFRYAGPLVRSTAWVLDVLFRLVAAVLLMLLIMLAFGAAAGSGIFLVIFFVLEWLSGAVCEWLWRGFTPGKRICGIRVVGHDGLPPGLGACLLRNFLRWADGVPLCFIPALAAMLASGRLQRLGDLATGTLVVYHERSGGRPPAAVKERGVAELAEDLSPAGVAAIDGETLRGIAAYIERRKRFGQARREELAAHLALPLMHSLGFPANTPADLLLCAIHLRCFAQGSGATALAAGIIAQRKKDWDDLEQRLSRREVADGRAAELLSARYRQACADLALAEGYHLPDRQVHYLHDLVARAHLAFYRRIKLDWREMADLALVRVPGQLAGDPCTRIAFAAFFGTFLAVMLLGLVQPGLINEWLGADMASHFKDMYQEPPRGRGDAGGTEMTGFYVFNNVSIALACFASGIFAGIGSVLTLIFNGIVMGLVFAHLIDDRTTCWNFLEFVRAHGPFELSGIALAGAAGLRLGLGIAVTGGLPRGDALRIAARRATSIAVVAAVFVALAAPIEGYISPSNLPLAAKTAVAIATGLIVVIYLGVLGPRGKRILAARATAAAQAHRIDEESMA